MPAAGMAGLIKSALALFHRVLPPTLHTEKANPLLQSATSAFALNPVARPWIHADEDMPRRAGVNAVCGFAGIRCTMPCSESTPPPADGDRPAPAARPSPLGQRGGSFLGPRSRLVQSTMSDTRVVG